MASLDIMLDVQGNDDVVQLVNNLNKLESHVKKMFKAFDAGNITMREARKSFESLAGGTNEFSLAMDKMISELRRQKRAQDDAADVKKYLQGQQLAIKALKERKKEEQEAAAAEKRYNDQLNADAEKARRRYDPVYAAIKKKAEALDELNLAAARAGMGEKELEIATEALEEDFRKFVAAIKTGNMALIDGGNQFGVFSNKVYKNQRAVQKWASSLGQQAGYQIQDFLVQVQSGQSVLLAFGQQGSQLAGVFGPTGAIVGAFIAGGTALAQVFGALRTDADQTAQSIAESFSEIKSVFDDLGTSIATPFDKALDRIEARFGSLVKEIRQAQMDTLKSGVAGLGPATLSAPTELNQVPELGINLPDFLMRGLMALGAQGPLMGGQTGAADPLFEFAEQNAAIEQVTNAFKQTVEEAKSFAEIVQATKTLLEELDGISPMARQSFKESVANNEALFSIIEEVEAKEIASQEAMRTGYYQYGKAKANMAATLSKYETAAYLKSVKDRLDSDDAYYKTAFNNETAYLNKKGNAQDAAAKAQAARQRYDLDAAKELERAEKEREKLRKESRRTAESAIPTGIAELDIMRGINGEHKEANRLAAIANQERQVGAGLAQAVANNQIRFLQEKAKKDKANRELQKRLAEESEQIANSVIQLGRDELAIMAGINGEHKEQNRLSAIGAQELAAGLGLAEAAAENLSKFLNDAAEASAELAEEADSFYQKTLANLQSENAVLAARVLNFGNEKNLKEAMQAIEMQELNAQLELLGIDGDRARNLRDALRDKQLLLDKLDDEIEKEERLAKLRAPFGTDVSTMTDEQYQRMLDMQSYGQGKAASRGTTFTPPKDTSGKSDFEKIEDYISGLSDQVSKERQLVGIFGKQRDLMGALITARQEYGDIATESQMKSIEGYIRENHAIREQQRVLEEAKRQQEELAQSIEGSMENAFMSIVDGTESVKDAFRAMARDIIAELYRVYVVKQMVSGITNTIELFSGPAPGTVNAKGNVFRGGSLVKAYANGGVVGGPTYFPMAGGRMGLMGEAGPEAIMPLKRGPNGKLGVEASGSGSVVVHQSFNFSANGDDSVRRIIAEETPKIAELTSSAIIDQRRRGGTIRRAFK